MSTIATRLLERAADKAGDPAWVESLVDRGRDRSPFLPDVLRQNAGAVFDVLERRKADVADLSAGALIGVATWLSVDNEGEARLEWLAHQATLEERLDAADDVIDARIARKERDDERWARVRGVVMEILRIAGPIAVQLLLTAL